MMLKITKEERVKMAVKILKNLDGDYFRELSMQELHSFYNIIIVKKCENKLLI
jgi:hypothetical protein